MHDLPPAVIASLGPRVENVSLVAEEPIGLGTGAATDGVTRLTVDFSGPHGRQRIAILRKRLAALNMSVSQRPPVAPAHSRSRLSHSGRVAKLAA
jgi:hypothetical protein